MPLATGATTGNVVGQPRPPKQLDASQVHGLPLSIGGITFTDLEHPTRLDIELDQEIAVQQLIGGGRSVQSLGAQPKEIEWKGNLFDSTALARAQQIQRLCSGGKVQTLAWGPYKFSVIVKRFVTGINQQFWLEYTITCEVVADKSGVYKSPTALDIDAQTRSEYQQAFDRFNAIKQLDTTTAGPASWSTGINTLGTDLNNLGPIASAQGLALRQTQADAQTILATVSAYIAPLVSQAPSVLGTQTLALALGIQSNLTIIGQNLAIGQAGTSVQVKGGSCYQLAAAYYGDPTLYTLIMSANNLTSPIIPGGTTRYISIPPATSTNQVG